MDHLEIYYFSGTGNSLHVARELQTRIPNTTLTPIVRLLKKKNIQPIAKIVGLIFPIHALSFPIPVKHFLKQLQLPTSSYTFAIATRECSSKVFSDINKILKKTGKSLDASFSFEMPETYLPLFEMYSQKDMERTETALQDKLDTIATIITQKKNHLQTDGFLLSLLYHTIFPIVGFIFQKTRYFGLEHKFYADSNCHGCGLCETVCLSKKIELVDNQPVWNNDTACFFCFACIHYCPTKAIQIKGSNTAKKGRYHHPQITAKDIAAQKIMQQHT